MIVGLYHLLRLDIYGLARSTLVMDYTAYLPFVCRCNRQHQSSLAQGGGGILVDQSVGLCLPEDAVDGTRHGAFRLAQLLP